MSDQNKDGLENFFRKGAENYDIDFRESDWKALEARLDEEMPVVSPWQAFLKKWWLILPLLIAVPAVWYFSPVNSYEKPPVSHDEKAVSEAGESFMTDDGVNPDSGIDTKDMTENLESAPSGEIHEKSPVSHEKTAFSLMGGQTTATDNGKGKTTLFNKQTAANREEALTPDNRGKSVNFHEKNAVSIPTPGHRGIDKNARSLQNQPEGAGREANKTAPQKDVLISTGTAATGPSSDDITLVSGEVNDGKSLTYKNEDVNKTDKTGYAVPENGAMAHENIMNYSLPFLSPLAPDTVWLLANLPDINPVAVDDKEFMANEVPKEPQKRRTFFAAGVAYSPDLSTVGLKNFTSPGSRWKVLGELHLPGRFAVTTGIVWVQNKYTATKGEYVTPVNLSPDLVDAKCEMIDIPLNLRYDIIASQRHRAFVSGGASTYLVLSQYYDFFFDDPKPGLPDEWQSDETVNYPFSIINISLGYEYGIGRRSTLQIEPFIKIATTGIGWGSVDLNTLGVYLSYKFLFGTNH